MVCETCKKDVTRASRIGHNHYCFDCRPISSKNYSGAIVKGPRPFMPYYDTTLRSWITSWNEAEKKGLEHRSPSHPEGLRMIQNDRAHINELKNIRRHKEDYKQAEYGDFGYKPGSNKKWSDRDGCFVKVALLIMLLIPNAYALEGVDYVQFKIKGKTYDAPIPNKETRQTFRELREALDGNELSREFLLGGNKEKMIYIGDVGINRWVRITKDDVEVIEHKEK